jgi:ubiquinone/menaquinone biosynthesis C-methylase UbiE
MAMGHEISFERYGGNAAENYDRYFVPAIGAPLASELVELAALRPGERVLDVACGTGIVAKLAAGRVGSSGSVVGIDINPAMLAVAGAADPDAPSVEWVEASADALPLADGSFDVALCQMGFQFFPDRPTALREIGRVLAVGGRLLINVPGPTPPIFAILEEALARHLGPETAAFVRAVFSLHDEAEVRDLISSAGFEGVKARSAVKALRLPAAKDFLWQYVHSTPLAVAASQLDDAGRTALEDEVVAEWQPFAENGSVILDLGVTVATARK